MISIPYTEQMLTNKDVMRRSLFIEIVKNPQYCSPYTGMPLCFYSICHFVYTKIIAFFTEYNLKFDIYNYDVLPVLMLIF